MAKLAWGKVLTSKTLWLNIILIILFIVQSAQGQAWIPAQYQFLITGVLTMVVRFLTNDSLMKTPETSPPPPA